MNSDTSFPVSCRVEKSTLNKHVLLIGHKSAFLRFTVAFHLSVKLVDEDSIFVDHGTENQICRLLLNQFVTVGGDLVEPSGGADPEDGFPATAPRQRVIQFIGESQTRLIIFVVRVVKKVSTRETC